MKYCSTERLGCRVLCPADTFTPNSVQTLSTTAKTQTTITDGGVFTDGAAFTDGVAFTDAGAFTDGGAVFMIQYFINVTFNFY